MISKKKKSIFILIWHDHIPYLWLFNKRTGTVLVNMDFQCQVQSTKNHSRDVESRETQTFIMWRAASWNKLIKNLYLNENILNLIKKSNGEAKHGSFPQRKWRLRAYLVPPSAALPLSLTAGRPDAKLNSTDLSKPRRFWDGVKHSLWHVKG